MGVNVSMKVKHLEANPELELKQVGWIGAKKAWAAIAMAEHDVWTGPKRDSKDNALMDLERFQRLKAKHAKYSQYDKVLNDWGVKKPRRKITRIHVEPTRAELPANARAPRTCMTFGWLTGDKGKLHIQYGQGQIAGRDVEWANTEFADEVSVRCVYVCAFMQQCYAKSIKACELFLFSFYLWFYSLRSVVWKRNRI